MSVLATSLVLAACGGSERVVIDPGDNGNYTVSLDPAAFVATIDNPFFPMLVGNHWVYEGGENDELERVEVTVTDQTRQIKGITATVVRDTVTVGGELVEDTLDWFAQDRDGNVWYLGEDSKEYEKGEVVSTAGSWEAGVDGAMPGIVMHGAPAPQVAYRQEFYKGEAEDLAQVLGTDGAATTRAGSFDGLLIIREWTPLEPEVVEEKYYARGIGLVLEVKVEGGSGRVELISAPSET